MSLSSDEHSLVKLKKLARNQAKDMRAELHKNSTPHWMESISKSILQLIEEKKGPLIIGGYLPIQTEVDVRFAMADLGRRGHKICLPVVKKKEDPLEFRQWEEGDPLEVESFGTQIPTKEAPVVSPDILLVPLLAFDKEGYRLGYGGGFYDRTISDLRKKVRLTTIGVAYSGQLVVKVPKGKYDQSLDMTVTEKGIWVPRIAKI